MATEIELKLVLDDRDGYDRLRAALQALAAPRDVEQINYYLDTPRFELRARLAMLRVRVAAGEATVTCKSRPSLQAGLMRSRELERPLATAPAAPWLRSPPARTTIRELGVQDWLSIPAAEGGVLEAPLPPDTWLHILGAIANTRRVYAVRLGDLGATGAQAAVCVQLELDHTRFSMGAERFELECEHADAEALRGALEAYLDQLGVGYGPATESKYEQFVRLMAEG